uniref:phenylalanine--tRNA ligase n=1 Tax=Erythrotrichia carnea TaxID=35151 RepID=A0A1C9CEJ0_9RHOD|nr:phenylalanyl-tRNA synthetase beta chain [Erythrotrichia carnea]AOM66799.1 phenylalanyl-tRNA synthetase beta chain [Erythrotrichia carnea]
MKISWEWLNSLLNLEHIKPQDLSDKLTLAGCEIEEINYITLSNKKDCILDITSTPNRSDLQGMIGIAKEICAILNLDNNSISRIENELVLAEKEMHLISYENNKSPITANHCCISKISQENTPEWITNRLTASDIEIYNDIRDIGNYIMLKWGHPIEITDLSTIGPLTGQDILFIKERQSNKHHEIEELIVTKYKNKTVGISGVKIENHYTPSRLSEDICIQTSLVPINIVRKNSKHLSVRNEASIRHERGLNDKSLNLALLDTILLIKKTYSKAVVGSIYNNIIKRPYLENFSIKLNINKVQKVLGAIEISKKKQDISETRIRDILVSLGCSVVKCESSKYLEVKIPIERQNDVHREIDLIEEIARIQGFNSFKGDLPKFNNEQVFSRRNSIIKNFEKKLRSLGMTEVIHYSLTSPTVDKNVMLDNPIMSEYNCLRTNLTVNLIDFFKSNLRKGNYNCDAFEIGRVFSKNKDSYIPIERDVVGGIFGGRLIRTKWDSTLKTIDWFEAKGVIELLLWNIVQKIEWKREIQNEYLNILHPQRSSNIYFNKEYVGVFGEIHPQIIKAKNLPKNTYCFELNLATIIKNIKHTTYYPYEFSDYSSFPSIVRDIAIVTPISTSVESIMDIIKNEKCAILKNTQLFDEYKGNNIEKGKRSIGFRLTYQSQSKTLTNEEVDKINEQLKITIKEKLQTKFR